MKIRCNKGYYYFKFDTESERGIFADSYQFKLVPESDYFTFQALLDMDTYSIQGKILGSSPAIVTCSGSKEYVLAKNNMTYNLLLGRICPSTLITYENDFGISTYFSCTYVIQCYSKFRGRTIIGFDGKYDGVKDIFEYSSLELI